MSEKMQFIDDSSNHKYYTEIPNIIFELGYSAIEISIYLAIKRTAGDQGICTKSNETIAKQAGVSARTVQRTLPALEKVHPILKKSLIITQKRRSEHGDSDTNLTTIVDIWPENMEFFLKKRGGDKLSPPHDRKSPPGDRVTGGVVTESHPGGDRESPKEKQLKKNHLRKTTTTPVAVVGENSFMPSEQAFTKDVLHSIGIRRGWQFDEIEEAWAIIQERGLENISDPVEYSAGIIEKKRIQKQNKTKKRRQRCPNTTNTTATSNEMLPKEKSNSSENGIGKPILGELMRQSGLL